MPGPKDVSVTSRLKSGDLDEGTLRRLGEAIHDEFTSRKNRRKDAERDWSEIDRQLRMEPEVSHKLLPNGRRDRNRAWMPETELPLQAQTLEMLTADTRRLKFPASGEWFSARAALTEDYAERVRKLESPIPGEKMQGSLIAQDNADRLAQAAVAHWHSQYDFRAHVDVIDAEAFKYGFGVGRLRKVRKRLLGHNARVEDKEGEIPVLIPRSSKRVYLDDSQHAVMHEGEYLGPNIIQERTMRHADLLATARAGSEEVDDEEGGWRPKAIAALEEKKDGTVKLLELEGDLVIESTDEAEIVQNMIATIAVGGGRGNPMAVVRVRTRGMPYSSYYVTQYHQEDALSAYGSSPLLKGMPIARAAAQALNRVIESALLQNQPPIGYSRDDSVFASDGGPIIYPGVQWATTDDLKVHTDVGGDPTSLFNVYMGLLAQYYDVTGVNAPRLGAQTRSHTTAFAKDAEITRGTIRTVDYVRASLAGPMTRLLAMEYRMGLELMRGRTVMYVEPWQEFVEIQRGHLPDIVVFRAIGAGAVAEDAAQSQQRLAAVQLALQVDQLAAQMGRQPLLDHGAIVTQILRQGGWTDVDAITATPGAPAGAGDEAGMGLAAGSPGILSAESPALETLG